MLEYTESALIKVRFFERAVAEIIMWAVVIAIFFMYVDEVIFIFLALLQTMQILFKGWQNNDHWAFFRITVNRQNNLVLFTLRSFSNCLDCFHFQLFVQIYYLFLTKLLNAQIEQLQ
jgi:hypothetical protein